MLLITTRYLVEAERLDPDGNSVNCNSLLLPLNSEK